MKFPPPRGTIPFKYEFRSIRITAGPDELAEFLKEHGGTCFDDELRTLRSAPPTDSQMIASPRLVLFARIGICCPDIVSIADMHDNPYAICRVAL